MGVGRGWFGGLCYVFAFMVFVDFVYWLLVFGCWFCCLGLVGLETGCVYGFRLWLFRCAAHWFWCFVHFRVWLWLVAGLLFLVRGVCGLWWVAAYLSRGCSLYGLVCGWLWVVCWV